MPVMHMLWWRASPGLWPNDSVKLASTSRFGLFNGSILQSMLVDILLEMVALCNQRCGIVVTGRFGFWQSFGLSFL